jgi:hypothetical protein
VRATRDLAQRFELADTLRMRFAVMFFLASSAIASAQEGSSKDRGGRMVFPPGATEPLTAPTPTPLPRRTESPPPRRAENPSEAVAEFFLALKAGQVDAAYDALVKDSVIADREEDVAGLKKRTHAALDNFGPISGYEVVDEKVVGSSLLRQSCISLNSDLPLRWRFYFYKSKGTWKLVDLRVDDALVELFEDGERARK